MIIGSSKSGGRTTTRSPLDGAIKPGKREEEKGTRGPKARQLTTTRSDGFSFGSIETDSTRKVAMKKRDITK
jgi:hypothetical protein